MFTKRAQRGTVEGVTNDDASMIDVDRARALAAARMPLTADKCGGGALLLEEVGSTNTVARELVAHGVPVGVVAADAQVAGRGRLDHVWRSAPGESFTVTFVVRVPRSLAVDPSVNGWLQMIAGLSTLDALRGVVDAARDGEGVSSFVRPEGRGEGASSPCWPEWRGEGESSPCRPEWRGEASQSKALHLKWPNDIYCHGRKLGGVLAEMVALPDDGDVALVFGIGLNLAVPANRLPTAEATSLQLCFPSVAKGAVASHGVACANEHGDASDASVDYATACTDALRDAIASHLAESLRSRITAFAGDPHGQVALLLAETRAACWTLGRRVEAHFTDGTALPGMALSLNADASLTLRDDEGEIHVVRTADVGVLS